MVFHSTTSGSERRTPSASRGAGGDGGLEKFPDHVDAPLPRGSKSSGGTREGMNYFNLDPSSARWAPRGGHGYSNGSPMRGHGRQKSLSDAIRTIRTRQGSVSQNVHEITDALKAPVSPKLIILCILWYTSSVLTNTSSKSILNTFDQPATLTVIQFIFVASYCLLFSWLASMFPRLRTLIPALKHPIRYPTREVIKTTMPLAVFQIGGHLLSSTATSKIPVSLVHTIKGLSPLFTVLAYRFIYDIRYPSATYVSLVPLTLGVMLACSGNNTFGGQLLGIFYALLAALIFVTQNIFSKKLFNEAARAESEGPGNAQSKKLDKLNLLCYSSGLAFILTCPIWFWSEGITITKDFFHDGSIDLSEKPNSFDHGRLFIEFVFNGTFHFAQNILAFILLSMVSPVTYSVASLLKRVFVITVTLLWFRSPTTYIQGIGIALTFLGLYMYDRSSESNKADRKARLMTEARGESLLPLNEIQASPSTLGPATPYGNTNYSAATNPGAHIYANGHVASDGPKKTDDARPGRPRGTSGHWLPPGTRQEDTWRVTDKAIKV